MVDMSHPPVCSNRALLIKDSTLEAVIKAVESSMKDMGLKIKKSESLEDGKTSIFAAEGALVPITLKAITFPLTIKDYTQSAQRSGIHVLVAPSKEGIRVNVCGIALNEVTGRPEKYPEETMEEVTDTIKSLDFEEKFIRNLKVHCPDLEEIV